MSKKFWITTIIRNVLTIAWVVVIWLNAHWSVALAITFIFAVSEYKTIEQSKLADMLEGFEAKHDFENIKEEEK